MSGVDGARALKGAPSQGSIDEGLGRDVSTLSLCTSSGSADEIFQEGGHATAAMKNMFGYLQSNILTDVVLVAGGNVGRRISAHKIVLVASSEYFATMFTGSLREANEKEVTLELIDPQALQTLVQYCYSGCIELREDTVEALLSAACLLRLNSVIDACCSYLRGQLDPCNCLGIALFAEQQSCSELHECALEYTWQHFLQVTRNQEFLSLRLDQLCRLLRCEDINVQSEEDVFESVMTWLRHDPETREAHLPTILKCVKLPLLSSEYLLDKVELVCGGVRECQSLIMEAIKWQLLPERRPALSSRRTRPRTATIGRVLAIGGMDGDKGASNIEIYDPRANSWSHFFQLGVRRLQFSVALVHNKLMIVGGRDGLRTLNTVECLDLTSHNWSTLAQMNTNRHGLAVAVVGEGPNAPVYAIGGYDGWIFLNTVERWDACARHWVLVASMLGARSTCGAAALGGRLYVAGGRDNGACLRSVECYDPATDRWTNCAPMIRRRGAVTLCAHGGMLYAFGGQEAPSTASGGRLVCVERYDPASDTWALVGQLAGPRDAVSSCVLGDAIVTVGGYDGKQYLNAVQSFDPVANTWKTLAPMTYSRAGAALVLVPNPPRAAPATSTPRAHKP